METEDDQIRHFSRPVPRRTGELGVHSLDRFYFAVPKIEEAQKLLLNLRT